MIKSSFEWAWQQEQARKARIADKNLTPGHDLAEGQLERSKDDDLNEESPWHDYPGCDDDDKTDRADPDVEKLGTPSADPLKMAREAYGSKAIQGLHDGRFTPPDPADNPSDGLRVALRSMGSGGDSFDRPPLNQAGQSEAVPTGAVTKGVKRRLRNLESVVADLHNSFTGVQEAQPDIPDVQSAQCEDGVSHRPVHDGSVPYEDRPEDDCASLPFRSTAPVEADAGKTAFPGHASDSPANVYDDNGNAPRNLSGAGISDNYVHGGIMSISGSLNKAQMEAQRSPGDNLPSQPAQQLAPDRSPSPRPGAPGRSVPASEQSRASQCYDRSL